VSESLQDETAAPDPEQATGDPTAVTEATARSAEAPTDVDEDADAAEVGDAETGDIVIDSALRDLAQAPADDLDAQIEAGQRVHQTLQGRLSDLGGE
jgi:hypothetical protein